MDRTDIESNKEKYVTVGCDCGMSGNKRYTKEYFDVYNNEYDFIEKDILTIFDNVSNKKYFMQFTDDDDMNNTIDELINRLNEQDEQIETLKEDVEIILDYVLNKGKFAMTVKEQKAHNRLRDFVRSDVDD